VDFPESKRLPAYSRQIGMQEVYARTIATAGPAHPSALLDLCRQYAGCLAFRRGSIRSQGNQGSLAVLRYETIPVPPGVRVLIATKPIDFRKGADSLAALAKETLAQDPFAGAVLVFRSRRADRVRILIRDGSGLVLIWKRLEQGAFKWPPISDGVMRLVVGAARRAR
jgi:transposase